MIHYTCGHTTDEPYAPEDHVKAPFECGKCYRGGQPLACVEWLSIRRLEAEQRKDENP